MLRLGGGSLIVWGSPQSMVSVWFDRAYCGAAGWPLAIGGSLPFRFFLSLSLHGSPFVPCRAGLRVASSCYALAPIRIFLNLHQNARRWPFCAGGLNSSRRSTRTHAQAKPSMGSMGRGQLLRPRSTFVHITPTATNEPRFQSLTLEHSAQPTRLPLPRRS